MTKRKYYQGEVAVVALELQFARETDLQGRQQWRRRRERQEEGRTSMMRRARGRQNDDDEEKQVLDGVARENERNPSSDIGRKRESRWNPSSDGRTTGEGKGRQEEGDVKDERRGRKNGRRGKTEEREEDRKRAWC
ncbi:hypothetical protein ACLOJK_033250 [Asimina triloba]